MRPTRRESFSNARPDQKVGGSTPSEHAQVNGPSRLPEPSMRTSARSSLISRQRRLAIGPGTRQSREVRHDLRFVTDVDVSRVSAGAGGARAGRWKFSRSPSSAARDARPPMTCSPIPAARSRYLTDLLAQVPDPREARPPACAGRAAGRRDRGGDRGVAVVRRDRAVGRRCRPGGAGRAGRGPRPGGGVHVPARLRAGQRGCARPGSRCLAVDEGSTPAAGW